MDPTPAPPDLKRYLDPQGRIAIWPGKKRRAERSALLDLLAPLIADGERISEEEVKARLKPRIATLDHAYFRRELVDSGRWGRVKDGEQYWRKTGPVDDSEWPTEAVGELE